jgi:hypothetical protein
MQAVAGDHIQQQGRHGADRQASPSAQSHRPASEVLEMTVDGERIAALEVKVEHLEEAAKKIDAMYEDFQQMKGAKWAVWTLMLAGGAVAGFVVDKLHKLLPYFNMGPR